MATTAQPDVCLIVEGAYPYVVGGVANWMHDLILSLPDIEFSLVAIKPDDHPLPWKMTPPPNVSNVVEVSLAAGTARPRRLPPKTVRQIGDLLLEFITEGRKSILRMLIERLSEIRPAPRPGDLLSNPQMFDIFLDNYEQNFRATSFHHYFWAMRNLMGGCLAMLLAPLPRAGVYHCLSTGFAGLMAARATYEYRRPAFVTEHGIYFLERQIEVMMSAWIGDQIECGLSIEERNGDLRDLWIKTFSSYTRACYEACDPIIALYQANNAVQLGLGAPKQRLRVISNGINPGRFDSSKDERDPHHPLVALIGRVVPIKDIKTFIRAAALIHNELPNTRFAVLGPEDEDKDYAAECHQLVSDLGLAEVFSFTGRVNVGEWLSRIDVNVLTSLSEAQPLVILEGGLCGIPVVAPDVGSCREIIEGRNPTVEAPGGIVTALVDPAETAKAIASLLRDIETRHAMGAALQHRVLKDYDIASIIAQYAELYQTLSSAPDRSIRRPIPSPDREWEAYS
jgi:glycosyltransferase involved in cell wall biosynthesis